MIQFVLHIVVLLPFPQLQGKQRIWQNGSMIQFFLFHFGIHNYWSKEYLIKRTMLYRIKRVKEWIIDVMPFAWRFVGVPEVHSWLFFEIKCQQILVQLNTIALRFRKFEWLIRQSKPRNNLETEKHKKFLCFIFSNSKSSDEDNLADNSKGCCPECYHMLARSDLCALCDASSLSHVFHPHWRTNSTSRSTHP